MIHLRPVAPGEFRRTVRDHPDPGNLRSAVGESDVRLHESAATIGSTAADIVASTTPIDLRALVRVAKPIARARYECAGGPATPRSTVVDASVRPASPYGA